ncbi:stalk domain-containing protein [Paenibacillus abyssi]|uniref:Copper amine oxidase-like N-terminal domain-containing protein n=1 Tax=Paenibacillus abyssi TaxID=1340531 RepID=A0A917FYJ0_9BACL|nr:stalk domain-containing protein [Paenibacillus abyssi]GGG14209.1 hypothetical protein GCM10010916_33890 [Paenibacillus abyssi]
MYYSRFVRQATIILLFFIMLFQTHADIAAKGITRLPSDQGIDLPFDNGYGKYVELRGADQYELKWQVDSSIPLELYRNDNGMIVNDTNKLFEVNKTGGITWEHEYDDSVGLLYTEMSPNQLLFAFEDSDLFGNFVGDIYTFNLQGDLVWKTTLKRTDLQFPDFTIFAGDAEGNLITVSNEGIISVNSNGEINWANREFSEYREEQYCWDQETFYLCEKSPNAFINKTSNIYKLVTDQNHIYALTFDDKVYALDLNGNLLWQSTLSNGELYLSKDGETLYDIMYEKVFTVSTIDTRTGEKQRLEEPDPQILDAYLPHDGEQNYYIQLEKGVQKVNKDGEVLWEYKMKWDYTYTYELVTDHNGNVYFSDNAQNTYAIDKNGNEMFLILVWDRYGPSFNEIMVDEDGVVYVLSHVMGLIAVGEKEEAGIPDEIQVFINGNKQRFEQEPVMINGVTMVPMRDIFEALGADVTWNASTRTITAQTDKEHIQLRLDHTEGIVNGTKKSLQTEPVVINGKTMVPLRFVSESLGADVKWIKELKTIRIRG